jgi:hypothetical protein
MAKLRLISVVVLQFACGCALEASQPVDEDDGTRVIADAVNVPNKLEVNGLYPNGLYPNGLYPNGLVRSALSAGSIGSTELSALRDPGPAGDLSRSFLRYAVSCAFDSTQTFTVTWNNGASRETFSGMLGLAPGWASAPLSLEEQRWVSGCIAARVNYYAISVVISMRSVNNSKLVAGTDERSTYGHGEGAFFGNLFDAEPKIYSCYNRANVDHSRGKSRDCAAGHDDGNGITWCGIMKSLGDCSSICKPASDAALGYASCLAPGQSVTSAVVSTFLN